MRTRATTKTIGTIHRKIKIRTKFRTKNNWRRKTGSPIPVGPPIAPVIISRVPVFQPTFRRAASPGPTRWDSPWGTVQVSGALTEIHRKILDAIFAEHLEEKIIEETGGRALLIDPYQIAKTAHIDKTKPRWLLQMLQDMIDVKLTITDKTTGLQHRGTIISEFWESSRRVSMPGGALNGTRPLYVVIISGAWIKIYNTSLGMRYRNILPILNTLSNGATHALALHILTHSSGCFDVDDILRHIGALRSGLTKQARSKMIKHLHQESDILARLGIYLYTHDTTGRLMASYQPTGEVHFRSP